MPPAREARLEGIAFSSQNGEGALPGGCFTPREEAMARQKDADVQPPVRFILQGPVPYSPSTARSSRAVRSAACACWSAAEMVAVPSPGWGP
jgi:hypothetical protein